jgi:hypothetical protein
VFQPASKKKYVLHRIDQRLIPEVSSVITKKMVKVKKRGKRGDRKMVLLFWVLLQQPY